MAPISSFIIYQEDAIPPNTLAIRAAKNDKNMRRIHSN